MGEKIYHKLPQRYYSRKIELLRERISLLKERIYDSSADKLKINGYSLELLDLEPELEKLLYMEKKEYDLTRECNENWNNYYNLFISIPPLQIKQSAIQIQEAYNKIFSMIDKEWPQEEKNILYAQLKDFLRKSRKIN